MCKKGKPVVPPYLYCDNANENWAMVSADLLRSKPFQSLSASARNFYIICCVHKQTAMQKQCLYMTLKEYYLTIGEEKPDIDLSLEAGTCKRAVMVSRKFVIPQSHLAEYGISPQYANKLKQELITQGFIKVFANPKRKYNAYDKRVTIYEFVDTWKSVNH